MLKMVPSNYGLNIFYIPSIVGDGGDLGPYCDALLSTVTLAKRIQRWIQVSKRCLFLCLHVGGWCRLGKVFIFIFLHTRTFETPRRI